MSPLAYFLSEAWRGFRQQRAVATNTLLALIGAFLVPAVFLVLLGNVFNSLHAMESRREMVIFLADGSPDAAIDSLRQRFEPTAQSVQYVSKEDAWDEMSRDPVAGQLLEAVSGNPLPASLRIRLNPELMTYESMDSISASLSSEDIVEEVQFGGEAVRVLDRMLATLRWVGFALALLIGIVVLIVVANTIRLTIVSRRETHRVLLVLGADTSFVRLPLILEGVLACLLASLFALGFTYAAFLIVSPRLAILPSFLPFPWIAYFEFAAALLGAVGGWLATTGLDAKESEP